jgi:putative toxin-antitoxin system antitoxin component (TIGR02293 family)
MSIERENIFGSTSIGITANDLGSLIDEIKKGLPYTSFESLQKRVGIAQKNLAQAMNINSRTLTRRKKELKFNTDESERLLRIGRIVDRTLALMDGDMELTKEWLTNSSVALGGKTPLEYSDTEPGANEVTTLIGRLEHGVFS